MKTTLKIFAVIALSVFLGSAVQAQTALTSTTLGAAITSTSVNSNIVLASLTGITATNPQTDLWVDGELMVVNSTQSGPVTVSVQRGAGGTRPSTHLNGATVYIGTPAQFTAYPRNGSCTNGNEGDTAPPAVEPILPLINYRDREIYQCISGVWKRSEVADFYNMTLVGSVGLKLASPTAGGVGISVTGGVGGAQSATTSNGAAGGANTVTGGVGGVGGTSSGTGGAGGALTQAGGAGGGTVTGGVGGAVSYTGGAGGNGTSAGGTGGALTLGSGAAGTGGTGTVGAIAVKSGATSVFATSTAGATTVNSSGTNQTLSLNGSGTGKVTLADGTDTTKKLIVDPSGATTATATTIAASQTAARTLTLPDFTGGLPVTLDCGSTGSGNQTCTAAAATVLTKIIVGHSTLSSNAAVVTFPNSLAFTSNTSYECLANDITTRANVVQMLTTSSTTATITNTTGASDVVSWMCIGN